MVGYSMNIADKQY